MDSIAGQGRSLVGIGLMGIDMRKLIFAVLLLLVPGLACAGSQQIRTVVGMCKAAGGSCTCPAVGSPDLENATYDNNSTIGDSTDNQYFGAFFQDTVERKICRVTFYLDRASGTIDGYTYTAKIWSLSSNNLSAVITNGTSTNSPNGDQLWNDSAVHFTFDNPTLSANTKYGITIQQNTISSANYIYGNFVDGSTSSVISTILHANSSGTTTERTDKEPTIGIYYCD